MTDEVIGQVPVDPAPATGPNSGNSTGANEGSNGEPNWLPARLKRAQDTAIDKLVKDLGLENPDELKSLVGDWRKTKDAQATEADKAKAELEKANKRAAEAEAKATAVESARRQDKQDAAIRAAAMDAKAEYPDDVVDFARKQTDVAYLTEAGDLDEKQIKALIEKARKDRPNWFRSAGPGSPSNKNGNVPDPASKDKKQAEIAQYNALRRRM